MGKIEPALTFKKLMKGTFDKFQEDINTVRVTLYDFLKRSGVRVNKTDNVETLLNKLNEIKIMFEDKDYVVFEKDSNGYIINKVPVSNFHEDNFPDDVDRGYYIENRDGVEVDHVKKRIINEV